ncbi:hypothetical protein [Halalkalirubrum salinum]|uniref:hypothetical protein n=1 Tax=Halalkalirubrum salinum TaxID=2563889 RepID=UPI0010FBA6FB|nr:hypothetical protein [Halalkalirubrum salinum]
MGTRRAIVTPLLFVWSVLWIASTTRQLWRLRVIGGKTVANLPHRLTPHHLRICPPPADEYAGVWAASPDAIRNRLIDEYGFTQLLRAYVHAVDTNEGRAYEVASCAYRADGMTSSHQLHVRLFPIGNGRTAVYAHRERNPNVSPIAHLKRDGYDPASGVQQFRVLFDTPPVEVEC